MATAVTNLVRRTSSRRYQNTDELLAGCGRQMAMKVRCYIPYLRIKMVRER
jgi:hypothetical protein